MQDYQSLFNAARDGSGSRSTLPVGVVNGVSYYSQAAYQQAIEADRRARQVSRPEAPTGTYQTSYGTQNRMDANPTSTRSDAIAAQNTGASVPPNTFSTSFGAQNRSDADPRAFDKGIQNIQRTDPSQGTYQTSYGTQNRSDADPRAFDKGIQNIQRTDYSSMIPDGAYSTSYGGGNINDDNQTVRQTITDRDGERMPGYKENIRNTPFGTRDFSSMVPDGAYSTSYGGGNFNDDNQTARIAAPIGNPTEEVAPDLAGGNQTGPVTGSSGYSLYGMADSALRDQEIERINNIQAGPTDETGTDETGTDETGTDETGTDETGTDETEEIGGVDLEQAGQDAYQRNLANILGGIDTRKQAAGEGFSDLYQQFRDQQTIQDSITDPRGLTGGMERQEGARQSAAEIGAMTDLASQRQRAVDEIEAEKATAEIQAGRMTAEQQQLQQAVDPRYQNVQTINTMLQNAIEMGDEAAIAKLYPELQKTLGDIAGFSSEDFDFGSGATTTESIPKLSAIAEAQVNDIMQKGGLPQAMMDTLKAAGIGVGGVLTGATALKAASWGGKTVAAIASKLPFVAAMTTTPGAAVAAEGIGKFGLWLPKGGKLLALTKAGATGLAAITPAGWAVLGLAAVGSIAWYAYRQHVANQPPEKKEAAIREIAEKEAKIIKGEGASQEIIDAWVEDYMTSLREE